MVISWPKLTSLLVHRPPVSRLPSCGGREVRVWCLSNHSHLSHQLRWSPVVIIDERDQAKLSTIELGKHPTTYSYWSGVTSSHYESILAGEAPPSPMQYKLAEKLLLKKVNGGWRYGVGCCIQSKDGSGWCRLPRPLLMQYQLEKTTLGRYAVESANSVDEGGLVQCPTHRICLCWWYWPMEHHLEGPLKTWIGPFHLQLLMSSLMLMLMLLLSISKGALQTGLGPLHTRFVQRGCPPLPRHHGLHEKSWTGHLRGGILSSPSSSSSSSSLSSPSSSFL